MQIASPTYQPEYLHVSHHGGDVQRAAPAEDYTFGFTTPAPWTAAALGTAADGTAPATAGETRYHRRRVDGVQYSWQPRGRLHLHKVEKRETYVCYRCGYPVRSTLVAVCDDNWDFRMCYSCYSAVRRLGLENNT
ncbi:hypothetical protein STCU_01423 [Strigomonas culicis]|nr:hypothetical protein STCU_04559 [Strigomonas culicis]EPY34679.1 hypothetical protein STCU_01423 [Strigomonas culicis]|eukprot:EPY29432.1 hypothetical protein STCU_04559 [Strigomonas culicis]